MLVAQARVEAERHELKRAQAQEKLGELPEATPSEDVIAFHAQLVTLTRRASVMESQVEVLEGKRKALGRFRDSVAKVAAELGVAVEEGVELDPLMLGAGPEARTGGAAGRDDAATGQSPVFLGPQEGPRREIARG